MQTTDPFNPETNLNETAQLKDKFQTTLESSKQAATTCCETVRKESIQACECAADGIRKNPFAYVAGAAFLGAAVCYLILEGRSQPSLRDRYVPQSLTNAGDRVGDSVGSAVNSLKFW